MAKFFGGEISETCSRTARTLTHVLTNTPLQSFVYERPWWWNLFSGGSILKQMNGIISMIPPPNHTHTSPHLSSLSVSLHITLAVTHKNTHLHTNSPPTHKNLHLSHTWCSPLLVSTKPLSWPPHNHEPQPLPALLIPLFSFFSFSFL